MRGNGHVRKRAPGQRCEASANMRGSSPLFSGQRVSTLEAARGACRDARDPGHPARDVLLLLPHLPDLADGNAGAVHCGPVDAKWDANGSTPGSLRAISGRQPGVTCMLCTKHACRGCRFPPGRQIQPGQSSAGNKRGSARIVKPHGGHRPPIAAGLGSPLALAELQASLSPRPAGLNTASANERRMCNRRHRRRGDTGARASRCGLDKPL